MEADSGCDLRRGHSIVDEVSLEYRLKLPKCLCLIRLLPRPYERSVIR
jgi:hypothetical protein